MTDIHVALQNKPGFLAMTPVSDEQIQKAEAQLGVSFSKDYTAYVRAYGAVTYEGHELTGICKSSHLNVVNVTLEEREKNSDVPSEWYVIEQLNIDNVSIWQDSFGGIYQVVPGSKPEKIHHLLVEYIKS